MRPHPLGSWRRRAGGIVWSAFGLVVSIWRCVLRLFGQIQRVDVVVYKVDRLGDFFLCVPTLAVLEKAAIASGQSVLLWASMESSPLHQQLPVFAGRIRTLRFAPIGFGAKLRRAFSVAYLLSHYEATSFICLRHGPDPVRDFVFGHIRATNRYGLSWRIAPGKLDAVPHEIARHNAILSSLSLAPSDVRTLLPTMARGEAALGKVALITPFSSTLEKDWPLENWQEVARLLGTHCQPAEIWVSRDQIAQAELLAKQMTAAHPFSNVSVKSGTLADLLSAVKRARLIISVDTFAAHVAAACDQPLVCLLGGGQYGDFGPWGHSDRQIWLTHELPCFSCNWNCVRSREECVKDIAPSRVVAAIESLLLREDTGRLTSTARPSEPLSISLTS